MDSGARQALATIRECVAADRFVLLAHFRQRLTERGLVWPDILAVLHDPVRVHSALRDRFDRPKWIIGGIASDGLPVEIVCVIDVDERGELTVFITAY